MRTGRLVVIGIMMLAIAPEMTANVPAPGRGLPLDQAFLRAVRQYVELRDQVIRAFPPLEISPDFENIRAAVDARAAAIAAARPRARVGDVFTAAVQEPFRQRIRNAFAEQGYSEAEALRLLDDETDSRPVLTVNGPFPWELGFAMVPWWVIDVLPPLPDGVEYRFVGATLVLVDVEVSLIVDILPDVLRDMRYARSPNPPRRREV